jgi:general secretion pathway protein K
LSLLAAIAASFATTMRTETVVARNQVDNAQARALADAGFHRAVLALASEGEALPRDGSLSEWAYDDGRVVVSVQAESGKVDLNGADAELMAGLFTAAGAMDPQALANAVIDFRDPDADPLPRGAEDNDYRAAGLPNEAKDRPFERRDELLQVMGVSREVYDAVTPAITVYSRSQGIDPATAPPESLAALPEVGADRAEAINSQRQGMSLGDLRGLFGDSPYLVPSNIPVFTIRSEATTSAGAVFIREAVVVLTAGSRRPFRLLTWEQGRRH